MKKGSKGVGGCFRLSLLLLVIYVFPLSVFGAHSDIGDYIKDIKGNIDGDKSSYFNSVRQILRAKGGGVFLTGTIPVSGTETNMYELGDLAIFSSYHGGSDFFVKKREGSNIIAYYSDGKNGTISRRYNDSLFQAVNNFFLMSEIKKLHYPKFSYMISGYSTISHTPIQKDNYIQIFFAFLSLYADMKNNNTFNQIATKTLGGNFGASVIRRTKFNNPTTGFNILNSMLTTLKIGPSGPGNTYCGSDKINKNDKKI